MATAVSAPPHRALTPAGVSAALLAIAVLAFALPYVAVRTLHSRRLAAADQRTHAIAERLQAVVDSGSAQIPPGTEVLAGAGDRPVVPAGDELWNSATSIPLARVIGATLAVADPWGNAYLVNIAASRDGGRVWVLSAGPDGIVQTPFLATGAPAGDDRAAPVR